MLDSTLQQFLFKLPPEKAHCLAMQALEVKLKLGGLPAVPVVASRQVMGLNFANPIGLAAGFDKNGAHIDALATLGFGFIEIGAVTPKPQTGNPSPRIFRLPEVAGIINRMGFNNEGADKICQNVRAKGKKFSECGGVLGINLGKNASTEHAAVVNDYEMVLQKFYEVGDFFTVNVSSPNTDNLRDWQIGDDFTHLLSRVIAKRDELAEGAGRRAPITVKIAPDNDDATLLKIATSVKNCGVDGVIACNTTVERPPDVLSLPHGGESGGLSGKPLAPRATQVVKLLRDNLPPNIAVIGVGGIMSTADMQQKLEAGADLVQIYTGLIYNGPNFVRELLASLK